MDTPRGHWLRRAYLGVGSVLHDNKWNKSTEGGGWEIYHLLDLCQWWSPALSPARKSAALSYARSSTYRLKDHLLENQLHYHLLDHHPRTVAMVLQLTSVLCATWFLPLITWSSGPSPGCLPCYHLDFRLLSPGFLALITQHILSPGRSELDDKSTALELRLVKSTTRKRNPEHM